MERKQSLKTSVYQFFAGLAKPRKSSPKSPSLVSATSDNAFVTFIAVSNNPDMSGDPASHIATRTRENSDNSDLKKSVFDWRTSRLISTPASAIVEPTFLVPPRLSHDLNDALPSPGILQSRQSVPKTPAPTNLFSTKYYMNHEKRGIAIIINNRHFSPLLNMPERKGTDEDANALLDALKVMNFDVHQYDNLKTHDMIEAMKYFASLDHSNSDCFLTAVLSHGDDGILYGTDGKLTVERMVLPFKGNKCLTLAGKPKIFVFQACRGDRLDRGVDLVQEAVQADDNTGNVFRVPSEADFLYAFSTIPGFYSWRNTDNGSWYIQALAKMITVYYSEKTEKDPRWEPEMDFVRLLTRVNFEVALFYKSNVPMNIDLDQQKQIPSIVSMLTKDLYFPAKTLSLNDS